MKLTPSCFHWRMYHEDEKSGAGVLQKTCDIINAMTPEQQAAVELYVKSEREESWEYGYREGEMDKN